MEIWFTSDQHFGHRNIIKYCDRPFADTDEMREHLIEAHNAVVRPGDVVYQLGDMFWRTLSGVDAQVIMDRLKGSHHYITGNHEEVFRKNPWLGGYGFLTMKTREVIKPSIGPVAGIVLDHFPGRVWPNSDRGSWQLYGHVHGKEPRPGDSPLSMDVGVDACAKRGFGYRPISLAEVRWIMKPRIDAMAFAPSEERRRSNDIVTT